MQVGQVMTRKVITAGPDDSLKSVSDLMLKHRIAHVPIVDGGRLIGIISDRDFRSFIAPLKKGAKIKKAPHDPLALNARDVMSDAVITADTGMNVADAVKLMLRLKIGALPVLDRGRVAGIITKDDLLGVFMEMLQALTQSSSLYVELMDEIEDCEAVFSVLKNRKVSVLSYSATPKAGDHRQICHFRLSLCPIKKIVSDLRKKGVKVVEAYGEDT
jgi:acetoin utilization protein AcuB